MHYHSARLFAVVILVVSVLFAGGSKASALTIVPDDAYSYNEHYYQVYYDLDTYDDDAEKKARELCKGRGGHLAVINDDEENENVAEYLKSCGIEIPVYIEIDAGYAEKNSFDVSVSDDGRAFNTYDRDRMNELTETFIYVCEWDEGKMITEFDPEYGKSKIPNATEEFNGSQYKIFPIGLSHSDAQRFCARIGGHLVSIDSKEENDFVLGLIDAEENKRSMYWTNTYYNGNEWVHPDGSTAFFFDWSANEPNNYENGASFAAINVTVENYEQYKWVAEHNNNNPNTGDINERAESYGFICEWDPICGGVRYFHGKTSTRTHEPDCVNEGSVEEYCEDCGQTLSTSTLSTKPHEYEVIKFVRGLEIPGLRIRKCSVCGKNDYSIDKIRIWFLPALVILLIVSIAAFVSAYADYRKEYGYGAPPVWVLFMAMFIILAAAVVVYVLFI